MVGEFQSLFSFDGTTYGSNLIYLSSAASSDSIYITYFSNDSFKYASPLQSLVIENPGLYFFLMKINADGNIAWTKWYNYDPNDNVTYTPSFYRLIKII